MEMDRLWEMERRFWLDGPDYHAAHTAEGALMVFPPPAGILSGVQSLAGLKQAPRWRSVDMEDASATELGGTVVLAYRAAARRDGQERYAALCSSTYARSQGAWQLLSHHQTPL